MITNIIKFIHRTFFHLPSLGGVGGDLLFVLLFLPLASFAQSGLHSNAVFNGAIVPKDNMVEVKVRGRAISKYNLTFYHSVRFKTNQKELGRILQLVNQDAQSAMSTEHRDKGAEHSFILSLPNHGGTHRYLCFLYNGRKSVSVTLVYMEGRVASIDELRRLIK